MKAIALQKVMDAIIDLDKKNKYHDPDIPKI
jgi:hypothetical protein